MRATKCLFYVGKAKATNIASPEAILDTTTHACPTSSREKRDQEKQSAERRRRMEEEVRVARSRGWWGGSEVRHQKKPSVKSANFLPQQRPSGAPFILKNKYTSDLWKAVEKMFTNLLICLKMNVKGNQLNISLNPAPHLNWIQRPAEERESERRRWLFPPNLTPGSQKRRTLTGLRLCDQQKGREKRYLVREWQISKATYLYSRREGAFTCQVLAWGW